MYRPNAFLRTILVAVVLLMAASTVASGAALSPGDVLVANQGGFVLQYSSSGANLGTFASGLRSPSWITTDAGGNVYVTEYGLGEPGRIIKFGPDGARLLTITTPFTAAGVVIGSDGTIYVAAYGDGLDRGIYTYSADGNFQGLFASPVGLSGDFLAFDADGNLYAPNFATGAILRISSTGADLGVFASLQGAEGIAVDSAGNLYVSSYGTGVIQQYSPSGTDLGVFAPAGSGYYGLAFDSEGNRYSSATSSGTIKMFSPDGVELLVLGTGGRALAIVPEPRPTTEDECKNGGWADFKFPRIFKSQGDCLQFVNTGK